MIGITGGIASGKSTVTAGLRQLGVVVLDADVLAREVIAPGTPGNEEAAQTFPEVIRDDGTIDRKRLGAIVFSDAARRRQLEAIIHPRVIAKLKEMRTIYAADGTLAAADIPLLYETRCEEWLNEVWVVYVDASTQQERLMARDNLTGDDAAERIAAQISLEQKRKWADRVVDNRWSLAYTYQQVESYLASYCHQRAAN